MIRAQQREPVFLCHWRSYLEDSVSMIACGETVIHLVLVRYLGSRSRTFLNSRWKKATLAMGQNFLHLAVLYHARLRYSELNVKTAFLFYWRDCRIWMVIAAESWTLNSEKISYITGCYSLRLGHIQSHL